MSDEKKEEKPKAHGPKPPPPLGSQNAAVKQGQRSLADIDPQRKVPQGA